MTDSAADLISGFETRQVGQSGQLHVRSENRRKTSHLNLTWIADLGPHNARRCLIPACLLRGTQQHPSQRELNRRSEQLWGLSTSSSTHRSGQRHLFSITAEFPDDANLPEGEAVLEDAIDFLWQLIHEPHLVNEVFPSDIVESEILQHRRLIEGAIDNKAAWAQQRCMEEACFDEPWRFHHLGKTDDLEGLDNIEMTRRWRDVVENNPLHVHFSGNLDPEEVFGRLERLFSGNKASKDALAEPCAIRASENPRELTEYAKVQQANLIMALRTMVSRGHHLEEPLMIANGILGGFAHSRLFTQVREKESLCYSIHSNVDNNTGLMTIGSGVDGDAADRARESILEQVEFVKAGKFSDEEFGMTMSAWDSRLRMVQDSPGALADFDLRSRISKRDPSIEALRSRIAGVKREDVVEAMELLHLDMTYLLAPEESN